MLDEPVPGLRLRLRHRDLAFHVDITLTEHGGRWLATAMLADEPDIRANDDPRSAVRATPHPPSWASDRSARGVHDVPIADGPASDRESRLVHVGPSRG